MAVSFQNQNIQFNLPRKVKIRSWIKKILEAEKKQLGQVNFVFTNDEEVLKTNIQFLKHDTYTDIITFDYCEEKKLTAILLLVLKE